MEELFSTFQAIGIVYLSVSLAISFETYLLKQNLSVVILEGVRANQGGYKIIFSITLLLIYEKREKGFPRYVEVPYN